MNATYCDAPNNRQTTGERYVPKCVQGVRRTLRQSATMPRKVPLIHPGVILLEDWLKPWI